MSGTIEQLRERNQGKWLLIRLDGPEAETGALLAAHEEPESVDKQLQQHFELKTSRIRPLYVTFAIPEGQDLPAFAL